MTTSGNMVGLLSQASHAQVIKAGHGYFIACTRHILTVAQAVVELVIARQNNDPSVSKQCCK